MTDTQLIFGIMQNDSRVWKHVYRTMKPGFQKILRDSFTSAKLTDLDIDDIFQDSLLKLMEKVKGGEITASRDGAVFSYLVQVGKFMVCNFRRKRRNLTSDEEVIVSRNLHSNEDIEVPVEVVQQTKEEFLDRVFDSVPSDCQQIFKMFYWDHMPMDEIASVFALRNANSAKTKKTRCMTMFKNVKDMLIKSGEFDEELVRAAAERAALRDLLREEREYEKMADLNIAALKTEKDDEE